MSNDAVPRKILEEYVLKCDDCLLEESKDQMERAKELIATIKKHGTLDIGCITEVGGEENAT